MTNIVTKASVLYVTEESTEGTPVAPSAGNEAVAIQPDIVMSPDFELLANDELKNSIGASKPTLGAENPTFSISHYLKNSGSAATAPQYNLFLKSFFGTEGTRSTERDTVSGSTTSVLNVDSGEGAEFSKGHFVLIKDGTNGYRVRAIESVATDALTMGFQLANAPASGVNLGRDTRYSPASTGHASLSLWHYLGNSGAVQMMSGAKCTGFTFSAEAGQNVNANFSLEGLEYFFNPVVITSSNKYIDFDDGGGEENVSLTEKTYKDPVELADAIATAMNAATTDTITCTYSHSTGVYTLASDGGTFSLLWNTGTNTANSIGTTIGFLVAADDTGSTSYAADAAMDWSSDQTASYDSTDPLVAKNAEVMIGEASDYACFAASSVSFSGANTRSVAGSICAESGRSGSVFSGREITVDVSSLLQQYDAEHFKRYRQGDEIRFQCTFGSKTAGNWDEGNTVAVYIGSATVSALSIDDADGLVQLNMTLTAFVNSDGDGECFVGFL